MKRPTQEALVQHWNTAYVIGVAVRVREDDGTITETRTRSEAWLLGAHTAVVQVEGKAACFALDRVTAKL